MNAIVDRRKPDNGKRRDEVYGTIKNKFKCYEIPYI